ncbi:MAG: type VI secretion system baseplate subunit TssG [Paracoccaceae bacterium]
MSPKQIGFFELLSQLETETKRFGRSGGPENEPARLGQSARQAFATSDIAGYAAADGDYPQRVEVNAIGLLGPEGPMPLHITRWVMARLSNRWFAGDSDGAASDTAFLEFCNLVQHRMIALYWRAWADSRPEVQIPHDAGGRISALLKTLAGIGLEGDRPAGSIRAGQKIKHGTGLAHEVQSPDRLTLYLSDVLQIEVSLTEYVGVWTDIPEHLQSRLGNKYAQLGHHAVIGGRTFERAYRIELRAGPMSFAKFTSFLKDDALLADLRHAITFAIGEGQEVDLRLVLVRSEVPQARLGHCQLGRTIWLNHDPNKDADDMCLKQIVGKASNLVTDIQFGVAS